MKTACVALKQFLFAGMVLAVGQLFKTTKIHAGELQVRGLARLATAEELQAQAGIDPQGDAGELDDSDAPQDDAGDPGDASADPEQQDQPDESESDEPEPDAAGGDLESSEESSAPVPKRRGRKSAS